MPRTNDAEMMDRLTKLFLQPVHVNLSNNAYMLSSDKVVLSIRMIESRKHKGDRHGLCRNHRHDVLVDKDVLIERLQDMLEDLTYEQQQRRARRSPGDRAILEM
jgi:hypothetical protein